jgi:hypothetical protein
MSRDYDRLCEQAIELNGEREVLIDRKLSILKELDMIWNGLTRLDKILESNYRYQEMYWPSVRNVKEELFATGDIVREYIGNPNQTEVELAESFGVSIKKVKNELSKYFESIGYGNSTTEC